jgi:hypothetical protein
MDDRLVCTRTAIVILGSRIKNIGGRKERGTD